MKASQFIIWLLAITFLFNTAPLSAASRFVDNGDQTITDTKTGLTWTKDAAPTVPQSSECQTNAVTNDGAEAFVACLNRNKYAGYTDWSVPSLQQLASLCNTSGEIAWLNGPLKDGRSRFCNEADVDMGRRIEETGFTNVQQDKGYLTATQWSGSGSGSAAPAIRVVWGVLMGRHRGGVFVARNSASFSEGANFAVWPVRGGN
jgi:hypothetical protein